MTSRWKCSLQILALTVDDFQSHLDGYLVYHERYYYIQNLKWDAGFVNGNTDPNVKNCKYKN
jgi:hypothetical protein